MVDTLGSFGPVAILAEHAMSKLLTFFGGTSVMIDMRKIVDQINDPDRLPEDDHALATQMIAYLNRIDQEWLCDAIIHDGPLHALVPEYCGLPEHDPFTSRCWDHTPGNLPTGHM